MDHRHSSFCTKLAKPLWRAPVLTSTRLTAAELAALRTAPEGVAAFGARLKADGRI